jgi:hypothetical protein
MRRALLQRGVVVRNGCGSEDLDRHERHRPGEPSRPGIDRLVHPRDVTHLWAIVAAALVGFAGKSWLPVTASASGWRQADPIIGVVITVAILGVLRSAVRQVGTRLMDAVDPDLVDQAAAAVTSVEGIDDVRELRIRWIGTPCAPKPTSPSTLTSRSPRHTTSPTTPKPTYSTGSDDSPPPPSTPVPTGRTNCNHPPGKSRRAVLRFVKHAHGLRCSLTGHARQS